MFDKCSILRDSARRFIGGSTFSFDGPSTATELQQQGPDDLKKKGKGKDKKADDIVISSAHMRGPDTEPLAERLETSGEETHSPTVASDSKPTGRRGPQQRVLRQLQSTDQIVFDEIKLGEASKKAIEALGEEEELVVLMPAKEFVIAHGPKRTVLYWLCRNLALSEKVNGFLEGELRVCSRVCFHRQDPTHVSTVPFYFQLNHLVR